MEETLEYHGALMAELRETSDESSVSLELAFFERMANRLEIEGEIVTADWIGFSDRNAGKPVRIDAIGGDPRESEGVLSVIVSDFRSDTTPVKINAADAKKSFGSLINFVAASRRAAFRSDLMDGSSEAGAASLITSAWSSITKVKLILMTNAIYSARTDAVLAGKIADIPVTYNVWDLSRFHRFETSGHAREKIVVDFQDDFGAALPALAASRQSDRLDSYLIVMGGAQLAKIYDKWGARLLESNVRSFLQARGAVNRGIRDTIKDEPEMFFSYNNGLSATADEVEVMRSENGLQIVKATNLQIVNGGQTTASLHKALSLSPDTLDNVHVQLKLTVVPDEVSEEIVPFISRYANSQNKVSAADFFSNHPFHMQMEQFSRRILAPAAEGTNRETKWFYERARGQYLVERAKKSPAERRRFDLENPKAQYFVKTDLAKVEMSFRMQPDTVSKGAQRNFGIFAQAVGSEWSRSESKFDETWFKRLIAKIIIFRHLEKIVPKQPWYPGGYRANIITYSIAKVVSDAHDAEKLIDLDSVWRAQFVPRALNDTLLIAAEAATAILTAPEAGVNNITEWGKKQACWAALERAKIDYGEDFYNCVIAPEEARSTQRDDRRNTSMDAEITAQQNVMSIGAEVWSRLREWGRANRKFSPTEDGILRTCSMLPGRIPSGKQSVIAEQIMLRARDEGYVDEADAPRIRISAVSRPH